MSINELWAILGARSDVATADLPAAEIIGHSREGRSIRTFRFGAGPLRVNLVGGCHADEPVGPRLLTHLVRYLATPASAALRKDATWSIIPHLNPDGAVRNREWQGPDAASYDIISYLRHRVRELPGDDLEFGFPRDDHDNEARPEARAAFEFWRRAAPFDLHVSMHGMGFAAGPYFLVERNWWPSCGKMAERLARGVTEAGYELHDVEREGEKGFHRLQRGFCSRPDSRAMAAHFLALGQPEVAAHFRPSSMETARALSSVAQTSVKTTGVETANPTPKGHSAPKDRQYDGPLTLVTEMPLFITKGIGKTLGPPDPVLLRWREQIAEWEVRLRAADPDDSRAADDIRAEADATGMVAMPVADQMRFQWAFIRAGMAVATKFCNTV